MAPPSGSTDELLDYLETSQEEENAVFSLAFLFQDIMMTCLEEESVPGWT